MGNSSLFSSIPVTFRSDQGNVLHIQPQGVFSLDLSRAILRQVRQHSQDSGAPAGILLDMRSTVHLSIVRLSHLIDLLTAFAVPIAVLFGEEAQRQLAILLHNTLRNREKVAYFVHEERAWAFVLVDPPSPARLPL